MDGKGHAGSAEERDGEAQIRVAVRIHRREVAGLSRVGIRAASKQRRAASSNPNRSRASRIAARCGSHPNRSAISRMLRWEKIVSWTWRVTTSAA